MFNALYKKIRNNYRARILKDHYVSDYSQSRHYQTRPRLNGRGCPPSTFTYVSLLISGHQSEPVKFDDALFGASSQAPFCEADNAFTQDHYASWTSDQDAPQSIWVQFKKASFQ